MHILDRHLKQQHCLLIATFIIVPHHTQRSKENGMVYIPYTQENMDIFQDIKVKTGKYGYFPQSGKVALVPCPHLPTRRK